LPDNPIKTVIKTMEVLNRFAFVKQQWGPRELSKELRISKSSAQRILSTLCEQEYLTLTETKGKYAISYKLWRICAAVERNHEFKKVVEKILVEYVKALNETMYLFTYSENHVIFEVEVKCSHELRYHLELGTPQSLYVGAASKLAMAYFPKNKSNKLIQKVLKENKLTSNALISKINVTKEKGYSITKSERVRGVVGIAAPIFDENRNLWGGALLTIPEVRYNNKKENAMGKLVIECANKISIYNL